MLLNGYSQETYTSVKGPKFFPGHLAVIITVDSSNIRYELYNHWYVQTFKELRQITVPLDSLNDFNQKNDSIKISIHKGKIHLKDKKYRLSRKIKHEKICVSPSTMRKISFAVKLSREHEEIKHYELFEHEDLELSEEAFKQKVIKNLNKKTE